MSVCEREREISSIRDLCLVNHIKKTKRLETRCTAVMFALAVHSTLASSVL